MSRRNTMPTLTSHVVLRFLCRAACSSVHGKESNPQRLQLNRKENLQ
jgi:hypothetical protein